MSQLLRVLALMRPYWPSLAQSLLAGLLLLAMSLPGPYLTKLLIDDVYPHRDTGLLTGLLVLGASLTLVQGLTEFLTGYFGQCVGARMGMDFQCRFYSHIQSLDFGFFDRRDSGEIASRFRDLHGSIAGVTAMLTTVALNGLQVMVLPGLLAWLNPRLALISLAVLPLDALLVGLSRNRLHRLSRSLAEEAAEASARIYESLAGIRTVQSLGAEPHFLENLRSRFLGVARTQIRTSLFGGAVGFVATVVRALGTLVYGWYGWTEVIEGRLSLGNLMAFSGYVAYLHGPLQSLIGLVPQMATSLVHTSRFFEIYDLKPAVQDPPRMSGSVRVRGEIGFRGVYFSYDGRSPVLDGITLTVPRGATVALVGRSGSGKSTLAKLVPRFYDPVRGEVTLDGADVRGYPLRPLRRQIGFAMQGTALFQATIIENLTLGRDIPLPDVEDAARAACIHEFIAGLPGGYLDRIGEGGACLSEGQKQRIALARVLLLDAPVLILDEPTASLDVESEAQVQQALAVVRQGRTTLIIAHRLSTIRSADEIVVLENGRVAEQGPHDRLTAREGVYAGLHARTASI